MVVGSQLDPASKVGVEVPVDSIADKPGGMDASWLTALSPGFFFLVR